MLLFKLLVVVIIPHLVVTLYIHLMVMEHSLPTQHHTLLIKE